MLPAREPIYYSIGMCPQQPDSISERIPGAVTVVYCHWPLRLFDPVLRSRRSQSNVYRHTIPHGILGSSSNISPCSASVAALRSIHIGFLSPTHYFTFALWYLESLIH